MTLSATMPARRLNGVSIYPFIGGLLVFLVTAVQAGCRDTGRCCAGRDASCVSTGWRLDRTHGTCYCDQTCGSTLDCCSDYELACPAASCEVSEWTEWSDCAEPCKVTVRRRQRQVLREPANGGQPCPLLEERAGCAVYQDHRRPCLKSLVPALITTGGYGNARKKRALPDNGDLTGYCVQFKLTSLTPGCQRSGGAHARWTQYLREGHQVCVECQPPALTAGYCNGDGAEEQGGSRASLQWQAVGNPRCRGVWRRVGRLDTCSCPTVHSFLFI